MELGGHTYNVDDPVHQAVWKYLTGKDHMVYVPTITKE